MSHEPNILPTAWVEKIFRKLSARYGKAFMAQYDGVPISDVMADWAEELAGLQNRPDAIAHAIGSLPERAPNVAAFRQLCVNAPRVAVALPAPAANPDRMKSEMAKLVRPVPQTNTYTDWIRRGLSDLAAGMKKPSAVEKMILDAARAKRIAIPEGIAA